ncbi:MAG: rhomboid family intramembrane serine protease [Planctomycetes bacterium]|nr:rhomboid family intramembrane serine protease [Planctomycetota bacterium]
MLLIVPVGDVNPTKRVPIVNYLLLAANLIIFFYFLVFRSAQYVRVVDAFGLVPAEFQQNFAGAVSREGWKLLTPLFLHGGVAHVLGNMLFLWIAGDNVEDKLGHGLYLLFYLLCGVAANVGHIVMATGASIDIPCIGASGAIAGVLGAYVVWFPRRRIRFWYFFFFLMGTFELPSLYAIGIWFVQQICLGKLQMMAQTTGVAYWAHIGGFIFGVAVGLASKMAHVKGRLSRY